jgi:hypothetical protein
VDDKGRHGHEALGLHNQGMLDVERHILEDIYHAASWSAKLKTLDL